MVLWLRGYMVTQSLGESFTMCQVPWLCGYVVTRTKKRYPVREGVKKKLVKSGEADRLGQPTEPCESYGNRNQKTRNRNKNRKQLYLFGEVAHAGQDRVNVMAAKLFLTIIAFHKNSSWHPSVAPTLHRPDI